MPYEPRPLAPGDEPPDFEPPEYDAEIGFVLDGASFEDEDRACDWNYSPFWKDGEKKPGYSCHARVTEKHSTAFSNATSHVGYYCTFHGAFFHEGVYKRTLIDHQTLAWTRIVLLSEQKTCECFEGERCAQLISHAALLAKKRAREEEDRPREGASYYSL